MSKLFKPGLYKLRGAITRSIKSQAKFKKSVISFLNYLLWLRSQQLKNQGDEQRQDNS